MPNLTGSIALSAALVALAATAQAGTPGSYTLTPVTTYTQPTYVQPTTTTYVQPMTLDSTTTTETMTTSQPEVGEIIYNTEPLMLDTMSESSETMSTDSMTTTTYSSDTGASQSENGSYVSSPIVGGNYTTGN